MTCSGCIAFIKNKLSAHPDIMNAELVLPYTASITLHKHVSVDELQKTIGIDSKYRIIEMPNLENIQSIKSMSIKEWLNTYKPLLLIGLFITGISCLTAFDSGKLNGMFWMQNLMAGFLIVFSFFKLLNLRGFKESYQMYDVLAKRLPVYGFIYPFIELALGIAYLTGFNMIATNSVTILVMGFSAIGVAQSLLNKRDIQCACLGDVFNLPMSTVTLIEDLIMITMAIGHLLYLTI